MRDEELDEYTTSLAAMMTQWVRVRGSEPAQSAFAQACRYQA